MSTLRVATLNIWNKSGPWTERLRLIRAEIAARKPDLIGLQEVLRLVPPGVAEPVVDERTCQATEIAQGFGYHVAYAAACDYGGGLMFGNAVLSRFPLRDERSFLLPSLDSGESRSLLYALAETPFGALPLFVTHLNWKFHQGNVRLAQVRFIAERVAELAPVRGPALPPVLVGDFNAGPEADEIRFLSGLHVVEGRSVFFADAWVYGGDGGPGATFARENDYARVAREPSRRIDYIFVRGPDDLLRGEPVATEVAFATSEEGSAGRIWPSDHFGLVTDLYLAPRSP